MSLSGKPETVTASAPPGDVNDPGQTLVPPDLPSDTAETFDLNRTRLSKPDSTGQTTFRMPALKTTVVAPDQAGPRLILREPLAEGGFGEVWVSLQTSLRRTVAVKKVRQKLLRQFARDPAALDELRGGLVQEALLLSTLDHPNIPPIYDLGWENDGTPLLAMKLVQGRPWKKLLDEERQLQQQKFLTAALSEEPRNRELLLGAAANATAAARLFASRAENGRAQIHAERAVVLTKRLAAMEPESSKIERDLSVAHDELGVCHRHGCLTPSGLPDPGGRQEWAIPGCS